MLLIEICRSEDSFRVNDQPEAKVEDNTKKRQRPKQKTGDTDVFGQGHTGTLEQEILGREPGLWVLGLVTLMNFISPLRSGCKNKDCEKYYKKD